MAMDHAHGDMYIRTTVLLEHISRVVIMSCANRGTNFPPLGLRTKKGSSHFFSTQSGSFRFRVIIERRLPLQLFLFFKFYPTKIMTYYLIKY
jgi:hypothetical protein